MKIGIFDSDGTDLVLIFLAAHRDKGGETYRCEQSDQRDARTELFGPSRG